MAWRARWAGGVCAAALWLGLGCGGAAAQGTGATWPNPGGDVQGTRYSTLTDITPANVSTLVQDYAVQTGSTGSHEGQPLVIGTTLYLVTPFPNRLVALDLANSGAVKWTYTPPSNEYARGVACCDVVNRGAVYSGGNIFFATLDNTVAAVNATTGAEVWRTSMGDPGTGLTMTGAPLVVNKRVIVGSAGGELGIRGWIAGLDIATGKQMWKAYNTGPDADVKIGPNYKPYYAKDKGTNLGTATWPGTTLWQQGGATVWGWLTYDPVLKLLYHGTANPGVWNPDMRPGDNKWGASVFARNPDTGAVNWAYQITPHDSWDFDAMSEFVPVDLPFGKNASRKLLVHFDKNGFAYTMDRATGQVLVAAAFEPVTWATGINLTTGLPTLDPSHAVHQGVTTGNVCPSPFGAKNYSPSAYSPLTKLFYVPAINMCDNIQALQAMFVQGTPFMGADVTMLPGAGGFMGELVAWNPVTGARAWSVQEPLPLYAGALATAGGVVFYGTLDNWFKAVDAKSGALLFQTKLECGIAGNPISFTGADGKQRIAVYTGVGWIAGGLGTGTCPRSGWDDNHAGPPPGGPPDPNAPTSGAVHMFKLP